MKVSRKEDNWELAMDEQEFHCLALLLKTFPVAGLSAARISNADTDAAMLERQKLLNECLLEHRDELKRQAQQLVRPEKWRQTKHGWSLQLTPEEREFLLGILNDTRVECWRLLGEPEELETQTSELSADELKFYHFMHLAGFFQHHLLDLPSES